MTITARSNNENNTPAAITKHHSYVLIHNDSFSRKTPPAGKTLLASWRRQAPHRWSQEILCTANKSRGFWRRMGFYLMDRCMYPISFILDSLRNDVRRFPSTIEAGTQDSVEPTRIGDPVPRATTKTTKYMKAGLAVLGLGILSVAVFLGLGSTDLVTSTEKPPQGLSCRYMTVSVVRGKLVSGPPGAEAANVPCTTTMLQTSQLCRDQCVSSAP
jgi:hypothetical protein